LSRPVYELKLTVV